MRACCGTALILAMGMVAALSSAGEPATADSAATNVAADAQPEYTTEEIRGRIVWVDDVLARRWGVEVDEDARHTLLALETVGDPPELHPIIKDIRGRMFHADPSLLERMWSLEVRRHPGSPLVQVLRTYTIADGEKFEFDYWCDICAIPMYELKPCECCQGPIRIRERSVGPSEAD